MSEYVLKLQKNIFAITLGTSVLLGISLAYLGAVGFRFWFTTNQKPLNVKTRTAQRPAQETAYRGEEEFLGIVTGNFVRDAGSSPEGDASAAAAVQAAGEIELMGVLYATPVRYAQALIKEKDASSPESYGIGKTVAGHKIVWIHTNGITVDVGGNRFKIKVGEKSGDAATAPPKTAAGPASAGSQQITLKRDRLQQLMKKPDEIYKNKFSPAIVNGKIAGWKLIYVPNDNFLYQLGARSGDILRRFNGEPLESQEKMIQMWQNLQSSNKVTVDIERGGKIFTYDILIQ
ncbi:MAG: hypothetical protein NXI24_20095 [bacterium]|nr:hypothetical protein [bacterium]